jgi:putative oxygen-independent coproporphyrinogen III oxidase
MEIIPLSLYIHTPWCIRKCPYCDFNSHTLKNELPEQEYIQALLSDLKIDYLRLQKNGDGRPLHSIFIGGGTPSLFSPKAFKTLFTGISQLFEIPNNIEITLEANPGAIEYHSFEGFREAGINRLSLGVQSLQDDKLKALGRIHTAEEAIEAINLAKKAGFDNFNLDIMHGLPNQNLDDALYDLKTALALKPTHFSWYQLTLEPNTLFYKQPPVLPNDEITWEIQQKGQAYLASQGYAQYEVSAYCQPNKACEHNLNYWNFGDYLGIGAGAHGKITNLNTGEIRRSWKKKNPSDYLKTAKNGQNFLGNDTLEIISATELPFEFMLNALRLNRPTPLALFEARTGLQQDNIKNLLTLAEHKGLIVVQKDEIIKTALGEHFMNNLIELFLV